MACPVSVIEIAPRFGGQVREVRRCLTLLGAESHAAWLQADTDHAGAGWARYARQKRTWAVRRHPVADILIGGFACRFQGLVTRNPQHFLPFFPGLATRRPAPKPQAPSIRGGRPLARDEFRHFPPDKRWPLVDKVLPQGSGARPLHLAVGTSPHAGLCGMEKGLNLYRR